MKPIIDAGWHHFVKVAELGSVSRAAVASDVPQSVVSRHIAQLESDAGSRLFRRTGRGVVLTDLGQQLYPRIKRLIAESESFADEVRASRGVPVGDVRLGLLPSSSLAVGLALDYHAATRGVLTDVVLTVAVLGSMAAS